MAINVVIPPWSYPLVDSKGITNRGWTQMIGDLVANQEAMLTEIATLTTKVATLEAANVALTARVTALETAP